METNKPVSVEKLLRLQTKLDIILSSDLWGGQSDVRGSIVVDMTPQMIAVAQTSPPILKSMTGKEIEATFVHRDLTTSEYRRWGWNSRILGLNNEYRPLGDKSGLPPVQAVLIALPAKGDLKSTNVRLDYRLTVRQNDGIAVQTKPTPQEAALLNFSAGGVMLETLGPPQVESGAKLHVNLTFPWPDEKSPTAISCRAEVVRINYQPGAPHTRLGLKFLEMNTETNRTLSKIINHYMLAEQRRRNFSGR